jgi:ribonuclease BN (tRNA processing enzyme)
VPSALRGPACHLAAAGRLRVLLDLGSGSLRTLARLGEPVGGITAVGLTHRHLDHVADVAPLVFALRHTPGLDRKAPLTIFGYPGVVSDLERLAELHGRWVLEPGFPLEVRDLPPGATIELRAPDAEASVTARAMRHTPEAVGFRLELRPRGGAPASLAYTGDTAATDEVAALGEAADLLVAECAFPDGRGVPGHLTPSELLPLAARSGARRVVATHFYPAWDEEGVERLWSDALRRFGRPVDLVPAYDGLRLELPGRP